MALEAVVDGVVTFVKEHESWAVPIAFAIAFGESFCFFSLLLPGTAILAGIAALLAASGVKPEILGPAILAAGFGGTLGYAVSFWIGRYFKDSVPKIWPFTTRPHLIEQGRAFFARYGAFGVFLGHFFGPVRAVIPVVAGMFGMRELSFQIANIASAFIWAAGVVGPAFYVVSFKDEIMAYLQAHDYLVATALFVLALTNALPRPMLFIPTLVLFIGLGAVYLLANDGFLPIWLAGTAGAFIGDLYAYRTGARHKTDTGAAWPLSADEAQHARARSLIAERGVLSVLISKLQGFNRGLVPLETGALERPYGTFLAVSLVSCLVWSAVYLLPAVLVGYISG